MAQGTFYSNLTWQARTPLQNNWKFPGLAKVYNDQSALAHHVVFETGVVKPLVDALRSRMKNAAAAGPNDLLSGALVGLMQVEADVQARAGHGGAAKPVLDATGAQNFIATDLMYLTQTNPFMVDSNLVATMVWTYENPASPQAAWPPQWISENINRTNHLEGYPTIQAGLETFIATATNSIHSQVAIWNQTTNLIGALDRFKAGENALFDAASGSDRAAARDAANTLAGFKDTLDKQAADIASNALFKATLLETYQNLRNKVQTEGTAIFDNVRKANDKMASEHKDMPMFADVSNMLFVVQASLGDELSLAGNHGGYQ